MRCAILLAAVLTVPGCEIKKQSKLPENTFNQLTDEEKKEGWILLFDGKTMNGWRTFKNTPSNSWEVDDGTLHCKAFQDGTENLRADLITTRTFENFELSFEWKIAYQGNSGVMFRVSETYDHTYATGPEYQVLDDANYPGDLPAQNKSAGNFGMHAADSAPVNPAGQWNEGKIVANGNKIEHWLNGVKVLNYEINSDDWNRRRNASKWKDFPAYASVKKGYIALQDHGNEVWYRNIKIKTPDYRPL